MPNLAKVDYNQIPGIAGQIRGKGQEINGKMKAVYQSLTEMHTAWYGKRYNELAVEFNNLIPSLNELLQVTVGDLPFTLETIASNYSTADTGAPNCSPANTAPAKIPEIPTPNDVGMRFVTGDVETVQGQVTTSFSESVELMNEVESLSNSMDWESEAATAYKTKFTTLKNQIVNSFENLKQQFTVKMNQTKEDMQATENANTVQ